MIVLIQRDIVTAYDHVFIDKDQSLSARTWIFHIDKGSKNFSRLSIGLFVLVVDFCTNNSYEKFAIIKVYDEGMRRFYWSKFGQSATAIILLKHEEVAPQGRLPWWHQR